ncbi:phosphatase PAP2 family protein [Cellulomonas sp. URHD0024]|uniref:phosphatase PAP2 family protein n=1 Tax=Cellulomonas sp. URHD0024 TaxID=1302620 RepID=UPI000550B43E|nr:phosphatase PAP2 family protein [Cellulomonas sp. URHD0024]
MRPLPLRRRALLRAAAFGVAFTVPVALLAYLVRAQVDDVLRLDQRAIVAATAITRAHPELRQLLLAWQEMFQAKWLNLAATGLCVWVWRRHGLTTRALWAFLTIMAAWALQLGAKGLVQRTRPVVADAVAHAPGSSFPSGHATNTAAVAVTVTLLVWPLLGPRGRVVVPVVAAACVLLTGIDRVMLGVHFPSDVIAGFALGTALAGASYLGYSGWSAVAPHPEP